MRGMKMSKALSIALVLILMVGAALAGCSQSSGSGGKDSGGKAEVLFWQPDSATWQPIYDKLIAEFQKQHPEITVKNVNIPGEGYADKLNTAFAAGQGPDVWVNWYANDEYDRGYIAAVDDLIERDGWDMKQYFQPITDVRLKGADGKYYGLPRDINMVTLLYNKTLFDKYGIAYPQENWTFDQFRDTAKKLTHAEDGVYGTDIGRDDYTLITGGPIIWNWMDGKDLADETGWTAKGYMDNPKLFSLYENVQAMINDGSVAPPDVLETMTGQYGIFLSGKIGMVAGYLWGLNVLEDVDFEWGAVTFPGANDGTVKYARNEPVNLYMNAKTKNKDASWEFMKFLSGEEGGKIMIDDFTWAPAVKKVWEDAGLDKDPVFGVFYREGLKESPNPVYLRHGKWWEAQEAYAQAFAKMMNPLKGEEMAKPSDVLPQAAVEVQKKLDELKP
jgi:multiple sugar transport system substrate-binding protein